MGVPPGAGRVETLPRLGIGFALSLRAKEGRLLAGAHGAGKGTALSAGDDAVEPAWVAALHPRRKLEPNPGPRLQIPDRNQGSGRNRRRLAGKGIRFARADNLA